MQSERTPEEIARAIWAAIEESSEDSTWTGNLWEDGDWFGDVDGTINISAIGRAVAALLRERP